MSKAPDPHARYREAYRYGQTGKTMPEGLGAIADRDPKVDHAYDAGANNVSFDDFLREHQLSSLGPSSSASAPAKGPGRVLGGGANIFLGMLLAALALSVVDYGAAGPKLWFEAKFLNKAATATKTTKAASTVAKGSAQAVTV